MRKPARYHPLVRSQISIDAAALKPGMRLAVGLSGGADSVVLLRALAERSGELGLVLHAAHLHHGLRGAEADRDLEFCRELAARLSIPFHEARVDAAAEARPNAAIGKAGETIEEAARRLRYAWFRQLLTEIPLHAVATAHTLDDQAETVLAKFLRGAWTEGLGGISPTLEFPEGKIVRPLLGVTRAEIEDYLLEIGQPWREDSSNRHLTFTRNRIRHELLPLLEGWNPRLREHLAQMASLAREEEAWWKAELDRMAPQLILPGKPVRGGGRAAAAESIRAIDLDRFRALLPAVQRRLLRYAAGLVGAAPDFAATESLRDLALAGRAGRKCEIEGLRAERTLRELRLESGPAVPSEQPLPAYRVPVPGQIEAPAFGLRLRIEVGGGPTNGGQFESNKVQAENEEARAGSVPAASAGRRTAILRNWKAGDRARLRHSGSPRKVKEILDRLHVSGSERAVWPVLELDGSIVWMKSAEVENESGFAVQSSPIEPIDRSAAAASGSHPPRGG